MSRKFYVCKCFYRKNIFLKQLKCHIEYIDKQHFLNKYKKILLDVGIQTQDQASSLIAEIENEVVRRRTLGLDYLERKRIIAELYKPVYPALYKLKETYLSLEFIDLVEYCRDGDATFEGMFEYIQETDLSRTYVIPVFTEDFCRMLLEEVQHFEQSNVPKHRPNTMNKYGVSLDELGFDPFFTTLREQYLMPVTRLLYPDWAGGELDSQKAFIVQYKLGEDTDLDYHYDNAEVTLNVALSYGDSYSGGNLYFGGMRTEDDTENNWKEMEHTQSFGLLHRGQHRHGAQSITSGERYNLIVWMRGSSVRNKKCPMCDNIPDLEETVGFGDGFIKPEIVNVCTVI